MANGKKSFVLYTDIIHTVEYLPDEKAGVLFKTILSYVNDLNPEVDDLLVKLVFEPIRQQLKRDLTEWEQERVRRSEAGKKGMNSRWHNNDKTVITKDNTTINPITNITDNVTVTVNDTVNVNDNVNVKRERAFAPPTKEELIFEFSKKLDDFTAMGEAEKFLNFYESKNWFVGKNKMKNWKAAAAGWITRMQNFNYGSHKQTSKSTGAEQLLDSLKADIAAGIGNNQG